MGIKVPKSLSTTRFLVSNNLGRRPLLLIAAALLMGGSFLLLGRGLIIPAKAYLSVHLLNNAWSRTLDGEAQSRPWPWMDSTPIARLSFPQHDKSYVVMNDVSGTTLAFAPGWHPGTTPPNQSGVTIISAHRDTHFTVLGDVKTGDEFILQDKSGQESHYKITGSLITEKPSMYIPEASDRSIVLLVTCYPLNSWNPGTKQRYVIIAEETP